MNSREIRSLPLKLFSNRRCHWRCCHCLLNYLSLLGRRASFYAFDNLFVRLRCVLVFVCFALVFLLISQPFIKLLLLLLEISVTVADPDLQLRRGGGGWS